ncbi:MAG: DnaD domain protein [Clostridia bacterium]|nr:DnaD domain protein [Clostridia bacterium]
MKLNFLQDVLVLPASVLSYASEADASYVRVLLWLASDVSLADKHRQLAKLADCDVKTVKAALSFWQECGVLAQDGAYQKTCVPVMAQTEVSEKETSEAPVKEKNILRRADELPNYTSTELANLLEKKEELRVLIDEAQRVLGKIFTTSDVNILVGMLDYLGMSGECVLLLLAHCKRIDKTGMRAIEKYAITLADRGITEAQTMQEELRTLEEMHTFEGAVRRLFGMKSRSFTAKESKLLRAWSSYGYGIDVVGRAYELTVNATNEASLPYANAILERWHTEGLTTLEQIDRQIEQEAAEKKQDESTRRLGDSFGTDDFFEAALKRSMNRSGN